MEVKFKQKITVYKYLVMFDLASKTTGVCLYDLLQQKPVSTKILKVLKTQELQSAELLDLIDGYFNELYSKGIKKEEILVSKEAMPTQLRGGNSTVQTFIALARSHAILDTYLFKNKIATYDYIGVYPVSTHAYFKRLINADKDYKVTKEDIREYLYRLYSIKDLTLDESDSIFLAKTLVEVNWNKDINEKIKELKRHKKTLKATHAIALVDKEIESMESMKN